ncbi:DUF2390 domain-containing protein [Agarivorans sp.]|uniref:DUF2390 domain-containing protein n=1 Tax=Agarivorans sp. TaxID=1872412 RepID=UPI003D0434FA
MFRYIDSNRSVTWRGESSYFADEMEYAVISKSCLVPNLQNVAERFWQFSQHVYANPELQSLCLSLQDKQQRNINLLLWLSFCQQQSWTVNLEQLLAQIRDSEQKLAQFRRHRKTIKPLLSDTQYQLLLKHELKLERRQQQLLVCSQQRHPGKQTAQQALTAYLQQAEVAERYLSRVSAVLV